MGKSWENGVHQEIYGLNSMDCHGLPEISQTLELNDEKLTLKNGVLEIPSGEKFRAEKRGTTTV